MKLIRKGFFSVLLVVGFTTQALATELMVWDKKPLQMEFQTKAERIIEFPDNVAVALPPQILSKARVSSSGGAVYFTALQPFESTRVEFQLLATGERIFADLRAGEEFSGIDSTESIKVVTSETINVEQSQADALHMASKRVGLTDLLRAASRDWYAPSRLKQLDAGIKVKPVSGTYNLDLFWTGKSAGLYKMTPLRDYVTRDYTLTAVLVENRSLKPIVVDLGDVYPDVKAVSAQYLDLDAIGKTNSSTVMYVISEGQSFLKSGVYAL